MWCISPWHHFNLQGCRSNAEIFAWIIIRYRKHDQDIQHKFNPPVVNEMKVDFQNKSGDNVINQTKNQRRLRTHGGDPSHVKTGQHDGGDRDEKDSV